MRIERPLLHGVLLRRYKRFLADVRLDDGAVTTVHCPNSGSMLGLATPGARVLVSDSQDPARKLRLTLERVRAGRTWVGVNTLLPNRLAREALAARAVPGLPPYDTVVPEAVLEPGTRIDFRLDRAGVPVAWVEVKSVTLAERRVALFPDAVTERGRRHIETLARVARGGVAAATLYLVGRADCDVVRPADAIDPAYGDALRAAAAAGVLLLAHRVRMRGADVHVGAALEVQPGQASAP